MNNLERPAFAIMRLPSTNRPNMSYSLPSFAPMRAAFLADESSALDALLSAATLPPSINQNVDNIARELVSAVRGRQRDHAGMQSFLTQYDLSTQEGVLLMCVAEALLRIPDAATADKLIKDKFAQGDWKKHLGASDSLLVNAGTWGMMLTGKLVAPTVENIADVGGWLTKLAGRMGEPIVRASLKQGMKLMAEQFVMSVGRCCNDRKTMCALCLHILHVEAVGGDVLVVSAESGKGVIYERTNQNLSTSNRVDQAETTRVSTDANRQPLRGLEELLAIRRVECSQ